MRNYRDNMAITIRAPELWDMVEVQIWRTHAFISHTFKQGYVRSKRRPDSKLANMHALECRRVRARVRKAFRVEHVTGVV